MGSDDGTAEGDGVDFPDMYVGSNEGKKVGALVGVVLG